MEVLELPLSSIQPRANQPRQEFDKDALEELGQSIRLNGLFQPITVRAKGSSYEIVMGERRWRACQIAGLDPVPCIISTDLEDDNTAFVAALLENINRRGRRIAAVTFRHVDRSQVRHYTKSSSFLPWAISTMLGSV